MTATPMPLPGMPEPLPKFAPVRYRTKDYETWTAIVRPVFEATAATGRRFTSFEVADEHNLPDPPKPKCQWGMFIRTLTVEGLIERVGYDDSARPGGRHSSVKIWRGTPAARKKAAA